jgi:hypothetical protein
MNSHGVPSRADHDAIFEHVVVVVAPLARGRETFAGARISGFISV